MAEAKRMGNGLFLSSVRVVEVGEGRVGPWAGLLLADLGAEIIKVESMARPDMARGVSKITLVMGNKTHYPGYPDGVPGERHWNRHSEFTARNLGKYGITLDLTRPAGLKAFMRLVKVSDVFLCNLAVGVAEKLGIAYENIGRENQGIIYLSATGYGRTGPYSKRIAMGATIDAAAGLYGLRDYGDGDSTAVSADTHCDSIGALTNTFAIVAALYHKKRTGKGMFIDVSMAEATMSHIGEAIVGYSMNKHAGRSLGNRDMSKSPQGCYRCLGEDQWVTLSVASDEEWRRLAGSMGRPELTQDRRFADVLGRLANQDELDRLIEGWTARHTKFQVMSALQAAGVAAGAVLNSADVYKDPHVRERDFLEAVDQPDVGVRRIPGRLWKVSESDVPRRGHAPGLGEHNEFVLREIAGLTNDEILELEREGIIGSVPIENRP